LSIAFSPVTFAVLKTYIANGEPATF